MEIFYFASVFIFIIIIRLKFLIYPISLDYSFNNCFVSYAGFLHTNLFLRLLIPDTDNRKYTGI